MVELLHASGAKAVINPAGGFVESWISAEGLPLLFARQTTPQGKNRGGIPVCAPIFGPGETVGLSQHGYARNLNWSIDEQKDTSVRLSLDNPLSQKDDLPPVYAGLGMELTVELLGTGVRETLVMYNVGIESCMVNPAFHPYFPLPSSGLAFDTQIIVDGQEQPLKDIDFAATRKVDTIREQTATLKTPQGDWTVISDGLPLFVLWTDSPSGYVCIEPTESGFLKDGPATELRPNESRSYSMTITFSPAQN